MIYVALLRGINVGGNNKVAMKELKITFEDLGLTDVKTYINSGNIIFKDTKHSQKELVAKLQSAIKKDFKLDIKVLIKSFTEIKAVHKALPDSWLNNSDMKCDVMFLWEGVDKAEVVDHLIIKDKIDEVKYVAGAILWRVDRDKVTRSGIMKLVGTKLYKEMTIRNCNTLRKVYELMKEVT